MALYTLDTSAVSAVLRREPGFELVTSALDEAARNQATTVLMPFVVLMETEYIALRQEARETVEDWLEWVNHWPVTVVESDYGWRRRAARVKAEGRISLADAWVAALALIRNATLVHKDPEFDAVPDLQHLRLPYDRDAGGAT